MQKSTKKKSWRWRIGAAVVLLAIIVGAVIWFTSGHAKVSDTATATVKRGPLDITVLEGGSVQALESQEIKCEVRVGYQGTKILKIIDEGYQVTDDDVRTNKVLVELDSTELDKHIVEQEIQFQSAAASLTDAQQNYDIQWNQNISDTQAAEQKARFAKMDFDKYLGDTVSIKIIAGLGIEKMIADQDSQSKQLTEAAAQMPPSNAKSSGGLIAVEMPKDAAKVLTNSTAVVTTTNKAPPTMPKIEFSKYAKLEALGDGEGKQKLRKCEDDLQSAQKEFGQSTATLNGTKRLYDKGFVTRIDLDKDDIANENARLKVQTAETARDLFLRYEFPRTTKRTCRNISRPSAIWIGRVRPPFPNWPKPRQS